MHVAGSETMAPSWECFTGVLRSNMLARLTFLLVNLPDVELLVTDPQYTNLQVKVLQGTTDCSP